MLGPLGIVPLIKMNSRSQDRNLKMYYGDFYRVIFLTLLDPHTILNFISLNKEINKICTAEQETKKRQLAQLCKSASEEYYVLPNGWKHGLATSGQYLRTECFYVNNVQQGSYKQWNRNGNLECKCSYKNGFADGLYELWYYNKQLCFRCNYHEGKIQGLAQKWDEEGRMVWENWYD